MGYNWFEPRWVGGLISGSSRNGGLAGGGEGSNGQDNDNGEMAFLADIVSNTVSGLGGVVVRGVADAHSSGIGLGWARRMLGGGEWRVPLLGVDVRL